MPATLTPEPARTEELRAAFHLLFQYLPPAEQDRRVANALHLVQRGELERGGILVLRGFFRNIPNELVEAAFIDGCSWWGVYRRIVMPLAKPALVSLLILIVQAALGVSDLRR